MTRNIDLPPLTRAADLLPASIDAAERTIEVVWSTGARVRRIPFFGDPFDEELAMDPRAVRLDRLNAGAPLLKVHDASALDSVIGSVVPGSARIENGRGIARVRFSDRAEVEPLWKDVEAGHIRAVSIGYQVHRFEVTRKAGAPELWRAVDWTPFEISAVPIGADPAAGFRADEPLHPCVVHRADVFIEEKAAMADAPEPLEQSANTEARPDAPELPARRPEPQLDPDAIAARARDAERSRVSAIFDLQARLGLKRALADDLVKRGVAIEDARREILDTLASTADETRVFAQAASPMGGRDERVTRREAVAGALLHRHSPTLFPLAEPAREYRGLTLIELAREFLASAGVNVRGLSRDEIATRALHSTSDFPEVLAAVTGKTLRQAYDAYPRTYVPFCRMVAATDSKAMHRVQLG